MEQMTRKDAFKQFGIIPFDTATLKSLLDDYKSPNDKVAMMEKDGDLIRLKRGLFVVSPKIHNRPLSKELIANHIYGSSYVTLQTALSFYGLIPERVQTVCSMTTKRSRTFINSLGTFDFKSASMPYYSIGVRQEIVNDEYAFLIATPEKALCDMIIESSRLKLQSVKAMRNYLEEDLRIDLTVIPDFNSQIVAQCIEVSSKKRELRLLYKLLEE